MKSQMRWRKFVWSEHVSSQIWCYLKLVSWRDEEWDEQMKNIFFLVWTCIKPNLVLSEISKMKRWRVRWRDEENLFGSEHVSSQIWCYLKLVSWRDEEWDEQMKNIFFWSEHVSSQIWCYLKLVRWRDEESDEEMKKICLGPNMYQAKSGVIWN